jgi:hypothetical protein
MTVLFAPSSAAGTFDGCSFLLDVIWRCPRKSLIGSTG